jgi:ribosome-binding factor A
MDRSQAASKKIAPAALQLLYDVYVQWVEPAPKASRLRVYLGLYRSREEVDAELLRQIGSRLEALRGLLRQEIAMTTQRRRTPDLVFEWGPLE